MLPLRHPEKIIKNGNALESLILLVGWAHSKNHENINKNN
jgi:hypothetical protein